MADDRKALPTLRVSAHRRTTEVGASASRAFSSSASAPAPPDRLSRRAGLRTFAEAFTLGRSRRCDLVIPTTEETRTVSKTHARIFPLRGGDGGGDGADDDGRIANGTQTWLVQDLNTLNGTALNGRELVPGGVMELHDGDNIVLSSTMHSGVRLRIRLIPVADARDGANGGERTGRTCVVVRMHMHKAPDPRAAPPRRSTSYERARDGQDTPMLSDSSHDGQDTPTLSDSSQDGQDTPTLSDSSQDGQDTPTLSDSSPDDDDDEDARGRDARASPAPSAHRSLLSKRSQGAVGGADQEQASKRQALLQTISSTTQLSADDCLQRTDRLMLCSICLDYFHHSATLPCSHTFCGFCISSWFRASSALSCPECRRPVQSLPVRNRTLDGLVEGLVGSTEAFQAAVRKRQAAITAAADGSLDARDIDLHIHPHVFSRWGPHTSHRFRAFLKTQFGEQRVAACLQVGLSDASIQGADPADLLIATANVLSAIADLRASSEAAMRLRIFLHYG